MRIARKCSYCGNIGHNSRTCNNSLKEQFHLYSSSPSYLATKRSFRKKYLLSSQSSLSIASSLPTLFGPNENSDSCVRNGHISSIRPSKKGMPWTEEEHMIFLRGLEKLGKGNWRGISRDFVTTKTPTQVASHAQKHFLRQSQNSLINRRKHHLSLHNVGCEKPGINLTTNDISCISQLSGSINFLPQWLSHPQHSMLKWPYSSTSTNCTPHSAAPDLELKLATPMPLEITEACSVDPLS